MKKRLLFTLFSSILLIGNISHSMEPVTSRTRQTYREEDFSFPEDRGRNDHLLRSLVRCTVQQGEILERLTRAESPYQPIPKPPQHNLHRTPPPPSTSMPMLDKELAASISNANFAIKEIIDSLKERQASALETKSSEKDKEDEDLIRILLTGPPGTGKTTLAEALAVTLNRTVSLIFPVSAMNKFQFCLQEYLNESLEPLLTQNQPCVIVIDEIDQLSISNEKDYANPAMTLCRFIDKCEAVDRGKTVPHFIFLATTNYPDKIPAALRSRFQKVNVDCPNDKLRKNIILRYLNKSEKVKLHSECDDTFIDKLVKKTNNLSIRDIQLIIRLARRNAYAIAAQEREKSNTPAPACITKSQLNNAYYEVWYETEAARNRWHVRLKKHLSEKYPEYTERLLFMGIELGAHALVNHLSKIPDIRRDERRYLEQREREDRHWAHQMERETELDRRELERHNEFRREQQEREKELDNRELERHDEFKEREDSRLNEQKEREDSREQLAEKHYQDQNGFFASAKSLGLSIVTGVILMGVSKQMDNYWGHKK